MGANCSQLIWLFAPQLFTMDMSRFTEWLCFALKQKIFAIDSEDNKKLDTQVQPSKNVHIVFVCLPALDPRLLYG